MSSPRRKTTAKPQQLSWIEKRAWLGWVLIPVLALAVYVPFVKGPFLFDDQPHIYRNQTVLSFKGPFDFESLRAPFVTAYGLSNRPLLYVTYGLNRWAFGLNPAAFRATNILIHLFNATVVFLLTRRIAQLAGRTKSQEFWISLIAGSLFLVHPLLTESVTYIAGRSASLCAMFYLLGLLATIEAGVRKQLRWFPIAAALISFVIGMLIKQDAAMLPIAAIALVWLVWPQIRTMREKMVVTGVFLVAEVIVMAAFRSSIQAVTSEAQGNSFLVSGGSEPTLPFVPYLLTSIKEWSFYYFWRLFVPLHQSVDPETTPTLSPTIAVLIAAVVILGLIAIGYVLGKRDRLLGASFVLILLSPLAAYCLFPLADVVAEHRAYLAVVGACMLLAALCGKLYKPQIVGLLLLATYSYLTITRNAVWMDPIALWEDASRKAPDKLRPHMNLGLEYEGRGRIDLAISHYKFVLAKNTDHFAARTNLAALYLAQNDVQNADALLVPAVQKNVQFAPVYVNLAAVRIRQRNFESALQLLDRAKEINPRQVQVAFTRGIVYSNMDRQDLAIQEYLKELDLDPNFVAADVELGKSYERLGDRDKATLYYQKVIAAEPSNAEALQGLARIVASKFSK